MTNEQAIKWLKDYIQNTPFQMEQYERAFEMAIQALSQESEIEENIIKYMKKYPNHVGNIDFWEGFYACRNVVLQLDDEEYAPKEQEPCDDLISREAVLNTEYQVKIINDIEYVMLSEVQMKIRKMPSVTQKSGKWIMSDDGLYRPICDKCGAHPWKGYIPTVEEVTEVFKYCPNCGAKMESEVSNG